METTHRVLISDSRRMSAVPDNSVELAVTSPPYPMIGMWDGTFTSLNPEIESYLEQGDGEAAFDAMHEVLDETWTEVARVLGDKGIACVNIGDATRSLDGSFRVYPNHARIIDAFSSLGFEPLPDILWRKPVNSAAKFMGSGMLPPNAYATLEHEYLLIFRKGDTHRSFEPGSGRRYESAYFWEERNDWFSDVWMDIKGTLQTLTNDELRERSAAFPLEIPYRLINMYSVYGDTVLDPFWGTGTTSLAAMVAGRSSVGYEFEAEFTEIFEDRVAEVDEISRRVASKRINQHKRFARERREEGRELGYSAEHYDFPVMTRQEKQIRFYTAEEIEEENGTYTITHTEFEDSETCRASETTDQLTSGSDL